MMASGLKPDMITFSTLFRAVTRMRNFKLFCGLVKHMWELQIYPNSVTFGIIIEGLNKAPNDDLPRGVKALVNDMRMKLPGTGPDSQNVLQIRKMFEELCALLPTSKWVKT
jgi:hypothetical protein